MSAELATMLAADDVLRAQMAHEAAIRERLRARQVLRAVQSATGNTHTPHERAYEAAVLSEATALRALHVAIAADMGVEP